MAVLIDASDESLDVDACCFCFVVSQRIVDTLCNLENYQLAISFIQRHHTLMASPGLYAKLKDASSHVSIIVSF